MDNIRKENFAGKYELCAAISHPAPKITEEGGGLPLPGRRSTSIRSFHALHEGQRLDFTQAWNMMQTLLLDKMARDRLFGGGAPPLKGSQSPVAPFPNDDFDGWMD